MAVICRVPHLLRAKTGGQRQVEVEAHTVLQALARLEERYPQLRPYLRGADGAHRPNLQVYVNDEHVRFRQGLDTPLTDGDIVLVVPTVMGG